MKSHSKLTKLLGLGIAFAAFAGVAKADIKYDIEHAASGATITGSGTYNISGKITVPSGVTVNGGTFNFTDPAQDGFYVPAANHNVVLKNLVVKGANHGVMIYGYSCTVDNVWAQYNHNSGIELIGSAAKNNTVNNCQGKYNADSTGGNADGFAVKFGSSTGNKLTNCDAHHNSDDGYDFAGAASPITLSGCKAHENGYYNGVTGNGCGFKLGLSGDNAAHALTSCNAYNNTLGDTGSGYDTNNNAATVKLTSCSSSGNKQKDRLQHATLVNCTLQ